VVLDLTSLAPPDATRALGDEEARELRRHARRFVLTTLLDAVLVGLLMAALAAVVTLHASTRVRAPLGVVVFAAAALVFRRLLVAGRLALAVRADAKAGAVVVLRQEGLELLARSKLAWTRAGAKAAWRGAA
jgi:hypothetical protein